MRLYEFEGKRLLAQRGVTVPEGVVVTEADGDVRAPMPAMAKAQVLAGRRGKAGAIRAVDEPAHLLETVTALLHTTVGGHRAESVLVEERLDIRSELYVAIFLDRGRGLPTLLASPNGGVDVEDLPTEDFVRLPLHPFVGIRAHHIRAVQQALRLSSSARRELGIVLAGMWQTYVESHATLVEINPLAVTPEERLVAADAKVVVDSRVADRFPDFGGERDAFTAYERAAAAHHAVGIDLPGDVAIVAAGAGVLMATADSVQVRGATLGRLLDMGGFPRSVEEEADLFRRVLESGARVAFFNFFTQVMSCRQYAEAILAACQPDNRIAVVARFKGHEAGSARDLLTNRGMFACEPYLEACAHAAAASTAGSEDGNSG